MSPHCFGTSVKMVPNRIDLKLPGTTTSRERYFRKERDLVSQGGGEKGLSETIRPGLISTMILVRMTDSSTVVTIHYWSEGGTVQYDTRPQTQVWGLGRTVSVQESTWSPCVDKGSWVCWSHPLPTHGRFSWSLENCGRRRGTVSCSCREVWECNGWSCDRDTIVTRSSGIKNCCLFRTQIRELDLEEVGCWVRRSEFTEPNS